MVTVAVRPRRTARGGGEEHAELQFAQDPEGPLEKAR